MALFDLDWAAVANGTAGFISLYVALQIRKVIENHEARITFLEAQRASTRNRNRSRRRSKSSG